MKILIIVLLILAVAGLVLWGCAWFVLRAIRHWAESNKD